MKKYLAIAIAACVTLAGCSRVNENNIVESYEWFKATSAEIDSKIAMIGIQKTNAESAVGQAKEKAMLELQGIQQSCIALVSKYNGKAAMITRGGLSLPASMPTVIQMSICQ